MHPLMYDRGRGPELRSCRLTVYDLVPYLRDPDFFTDEYLTALWRITGDELSALKQHIAHHHEAVTAENARIEERLRREHQAQWEAVKDRPPFWTEDRLRQFRAWRQARNGRDDGHKLTPDEHRELTRAFRAWVEAQAAGGAAA